MGATIGAALKKIAVSLLTDKKVLKAVGGIVLGIIIIIVTPVVAVLSIFNGDTEIDYDSLNTKIEENLSAEQSSSLSEIDSVMTEIEEKLDDEDLSDYNAYAEAIYIFYFSDQTQGDSFVDDFVGCFKKNISTDKLIENFKDKFSVEIDKDALEKTVESIENSEAESG